MAVWTFLDKKNVGYSWNEDGVKVSCFDDGLAFVPGEDGFTDAHAIAKAAALGAGITLEYSGTPNWHERIEAEARAAAEAEQAHARKQAAEAELEAMLKPADPTVEQKAAVNARFDAMLDTLPERRADIEKLRKAELEAI